ncbi:MAG: phosphoglycerate dehydrogenase [Gammaproteobacteria bacterium]|nr:phosphoglycerate dehydrogenase [Gammaproteobacteria bacterium]
MQKFSLDKSKIRILLLEGISPRAVETLKSAGYTNIDYVKGALDGEALEEKLKEAHFVGIRSRTQLTEAVLAKAPKLIGIGCFCIGTNQVDLVAAQKRGVVVFNAPFSNTRSVAELALGQILLLLRGIPERNALAHRGIWKKSADNSFEARGKVLGIVGYGHIGSQLSVLAETVGMRVIFFDIETKLPLGNASQVDTMGELLKTADVVSLHVPETASTKDMMGAAEFSQMKQGAIFLNNARGTVVDIDALVDALKSGRVGGAAIDVFPVEPATNNEPFESPLRGFDNVILTPHVGGSTQEAQENIGTEVASKMVKYSDNGSTLTAVNFPEVSLPVHAKWSRLLHIHENRPGILKEINRAFADKEINIAAQYLQTNENIGYVVIDIDSEQADVALAELKAIAGTIRCRILH